MRPTSEASVNQPTPEQRADTVARLRATFRTGRTKPLEWRTGRLRRLRAMLTERGDEVAAALHADLGKTTRQAYGSEIDFTLRPAVRRGEGERHGQLATAAAPSRPSAIARRSSPSP